MALPKGRDEYGVFVQARLIRDPQSDGGMSHWVLPGTRQQIGTWHGPPPRGAIHYRQGMFDLFTGRYHYGVKKLPLLKNPPKKSVVKLKNGLRLVYLPTNQAWILMWHNTRVKGPAPYNEIVQWMKKVYPGDETGAIPNPLSSKTKRRALKTAVKLAYHIYKDVKAKHFSRHHLTKRTPALVRKYAKIILDANGIKMSMLKK